MMNELTKYSQQLPDTIEDISKFVLVGTEKMKALKAEIRAIEKLHLAEEVYSQKMGEARMLSELIIDAGVRMGELKPSIPKASGGDRKSQEIKSNHMGTFDKQNKGVTKTYNDLGFSKKQMYEFETLADNKDLVEQVKHEARGNGILPTKSRVIDLAQQRKKKETEEQVKDDNFNAYIDGCKKVANGFNKAIYSFIYIDTDADAFKKWKELLDANSIPSYLREVEEGIVKLIAIQKFLREVKK